MVTDAATLAQICERARAVGVVAIDTEFVWERTYFPSLGIIQLGVNEEECWILEAATTDHLGPLGDLLRDPSVVKILHDARQDLTILRRATGASPTNVFDTQHAAAFAGMGASVSLRVLLKTMVRVDLAKTETQSDWLQRPLSEEQCSYALDDVRYLPKVREKLLRLADKRGRSAWLAEDLAEYDDASLYEERAMEDAWERLRGMPRLTGHQRGAARALCAWREGLAQRLNRPRHFLVNDESIVSILLKNPASLPDLKAIKGLSEKLIERNGNEILRVLRDAQPLPEDEGERRRRQEEDALGFRADLVMALLRSRCLDAEIDPVLIANRAEIRDVTSEGETAATSRFGLLKGWRRRFFGNDLLALRGGHCAIKIDPKSGVLDTIPAPETLPKHAAEAEFDFSPPKEPSAPVS